MRRGGLLGVLIAVFLVLLLVGAVLVLSVGGKALIKPSPKKTAGRLVTVGTFTASELEIRDVVANVLIVGGNTSGIVVKSNLPVRVSAQGDALILYCPEEKTGLFKRRNVCSEYGNGTVVVEVPGKLEGINLQDLVGNVLIETRAASVEMSDVVGTIVGREWASYRISDVVGDIRIKAEGSVEIRNVVGNIAISVPRGASVVLEKKDVMGSVTERTHGGSTAVEVSLSDVMGDVTIG